MKKAVTLVEVIAGAMILAITFGGLLATFISVRKYVNRANKRLIATNLAVCKLNDLYRAVREDTWGSGSLSAPLTQNLSSFTIDNHVYQDAAKPNKYIVTAVGDYRRVTVTVNYPD